MKFRKPNEQEEICQNMQKLLLFEATGCCIKPVFLKSCDKISE